MPVDADLSWDRMSFIGETLLDPSEWSPSAPARSLQPGLRLAPGRGIQVLEVISQ